MTDPLLAQFGVKTDRGGRKITVSMEQSHTTADFENIIYDGDYFNMFESESNDVFCEKFGNCLKYKKGNIIGGYKNEVPITRRNRN